VHGYVHIQNTYIPANVPPVPVEKVTASTFPSIEIS